jgi:hypothetical protein
MWNNSTMSYFSIVNILHIIIFNSRKLYEKTFLNANIKIWISLYKIQDVPTYYFLSNVARKNSIAYYIIIN